MKKVVLHFFIIALLLDSCNVAEPVFVSHDNLRFVGINDSTFQFTVDGKIYNPTIIKYQLKELAFDIHYNGEKMGSGSMATPQQITPKDTTALPFNCTLSLAQLQKKHKQILSGETVDLYFVGEAYAVHPIKKIRKGVEVKVPYDAKSFISDYLLDRDLVLDEIEIERINPFSLGNPTKSTMRLTIKVYNKQPFDYKIEKIQLSLKSKRTNRVVLEGGMDSIVDSPSLQTVKVPLDIETNNFNLLHNLGSGFFNEDSNKYIGSGLVIIRIEGYDFEIPFTKEFDIGTNSFGSLEVCPDLYRTYGLAYEPLGIRVFEWTKEYGTHK